MASIDVIKGDITELSVDAIVNAANSSLLGGGGVDGAIHRKAGPELLAECRTLHGCKTGDAKMTKGYRLPARYVIHGAVMGQDLTTNRDLVARTTRRCLEVADELGARSLALPAFGTGVGGFPLEECARVMVAEARGFDPDSVERVIFAVFGAQAERAFRTALEDSE